MIEAGTSGEVLQQLTYLDGVTSPLIERASDMNVRLGSTRKIAARKKPLLGVRFCAVDPASKSLPQPHFIADRRA